MDLLNNTTDEVQKELLLETYKNLKPPKETEPNLEKINELYIKIREL